jgi:DNA-binding CsgD family transcriptional regulator
MKAYGEHFVRHDLWAQVATPERGNRALLMHDLVTPRIWERSEIYNDFVRPESDFFWCLGAAMPMSDGQIGMLGVLRDRGDKPFVPSEGSELDAVLPHLTRGLQLTHRLRGLQFDLAHARSALDRIAFGLVICDADGKVRHANRIAEEILSADDGIALGADQILQIADEGGQQQLTQVISAAARRATNGGALRIARTGRAPLKLLVAPLPEAQHAALGGAGGALVLIDDPERGAAPALDALKTLFGLTAAEARLARRLAQGDLTAPEIAAEFALSPQTIRTQIKSLHRKMEVSHQAEISAIVSRLGLLG